MATLEHHRFLVIASNVHCTVPLSDAFCITLHCSSLRIFRSFRCLEYDRGEGMKALSYLEADASIDCLKSRYEATRVIAALFACIYPLGVPLAILIMLWRLKDQLTPPRSAGEDEISIIEKLAESNVYEGIARFSLQLRPQFW